MMEEKVELAVCGMESNKTFAGDIRLPRLGRLRFFFSFNKHECACAQGV